MKLFIVTFLSLVSFCTTSKNAPKEFNVFRVHQIDIQGSPQGARSPTMNLEVNTIKLVSRLILFFQGVRYDKSVPLTSYFRKCVVIRLNEIDSDFDTLKVHAGGILIVIPPSLVLDSERAAALDEWEKSLMSESIKIPIYFVHESQAILQVLDDIKTNQSKQSGIINDIVSDVFQFSISTAPVAVKDPEVAVIESKYQVSDELPTVIITSYYDAYGIAPALAYGADSNAGGVIASIQLMKILSKLFADSRKNLKVNVVSILSGGGKLNYWGTKKWLDQLDQKLEHNAFLSNVAVVLSLDSLAASDGPLYIHSSSSPKADSIATAFISALGNATSTELVIKKINLAEESLAWEHERFATRRLPSLTLSSLYNPRTSSRSSIFDTCDKFNLDTLNKRILAISNALQVVINGKIGMKSDFSVSSLQTLLDKLCSSSRSQQLLSSTSPQIVKDIESIVRKFSRLVTVHRFKTSKKDAEFTFYEPSQVKLSIFM